MSKLYSVFKKLKESNKDTVYLFKSGFFYIAISDDDNLLSSKFNFKLTNLNNSFVIDNITEIEIYFISKDYLPKNNELNFYYEKYPMRCKPDKYKVTCKIPINILEFMKKSYIYSKLSCENTIKIGWIQINDTYIKHIYELFTILNYAEIKAKYDPSQKSQNMTLI